MNGHVGDPVGIVVGVAKVVVFAQILMRSGELIRVGCILSLPSTEGLK